MMLNVYYQNLLTKEIKLGPLEFKFWFHKPTKNFNKKTSYLIQKHFSDKVSYYNKKQTVYTRKDADFVIAIYPGRIQFNLDYDKEKDSFKRMVALITELKRDYNIFYTVSFLEEEKEKEPELQKTLQINEISM